MTKTRKQAVKPGLLSILNSHVGRANAVRASELAKTLRWSLLNVAREVWGFKMIGLAICGDLKSGYYIAESADDLLEICSDMRSRALHALRMEARLRGVPCVDVLSGIAADLEKSEGHRIGVIKPASMFHD